MMRIARNLQTILLCALLFLAGCSGDTPEALLASAKDHLAKNDNKSAIIQAKNALLKKPNFAEARFVLGKALLASNDFGAAELEFGKALELRYSADLVLPELMRTQLALGKYAKVIEQAASSTVLTAASRADLAAVLAAAYLAQKKPAQSHEAVARALADRPDHVEALMVLAKLKGGEGDMPGALKSIDAAIAKAPRNAEALFLKAKLLAAANQIEPALEAYRKVIEVRADAIAAHAELSLLLMGAGKVALAKQQIDAMSKLAPGHPFTILSKAIFAFASADYLGARALCQQLLKGAGDNPVTLQLAGAVEYRIGNHVQAQDFLEKAVKLAPESIVNRRWLALNELAMGKPARAFNAIEPVLGRIEGDVSMLSLAGEVYMHLGEAKKGEEAYQKALKLDPKDAAMRTTVALARFVRGEQDAAYAEFSQIAAEDSGTIADRALMAASLRRGQFDQALKAIDGIEKKTPNDPAVFNLRGQVQLAKGDAKGARASFERILAISPGYYAAAASLADLDIADGRLDLAQQRFERLIAADAKSSDAYVALAQVRAANKAPAADVLELINKAITASPTETGPRVALVSFHLTAKEFKKAVAAAQDAVAVIRDKPQLFDLLGRAQQAAGETNQAVATYAKLASSGTGVVQAYLRMAEIHVEAGELEAAARALRKALEARPDLVAAQRGLIMLDINKDRPIDALAIAKQVQKQRPAEADGYLLEGAIGASRKSWSEAADAYRNGLKQSPASTELAIRLHASLLAAGKSAEADRFAESWIKANPKDLIFRFGLGDRARDRGDYAAAGAHYRAVLASTPDNPLLLNNLAWVAGKLRQPDAVALAEKANKLAPDQPAIMDTLAMLVAEKGGVVQALALLDKAVQGAPELAEIRLNRARVLIQADRKADARKDLEVLAKMGDKFVAQAEVAKILKDL